jgi:hypothetical protein
MFLPSPIEAFHGRRETRAERVSKKTDRLPDEMIFPTRSLGSPNNEREEEEYIEYVYLPLKTRKGQTALCTNV